MQAKLVSQVAAEFEPQIAGSGRHIVLEGECAPGSCRIDADPEALSVALRNLVDNALKYSPDCHEVWVQWGLEQAHVAIKIRDRGLGITDVGETKHFPEVRPGQRGGDGQRPGLRGWAGHGPAHCGGAWRSSHGDERAGKREHVHHPAPPERTKRAQHIRRARVYQRD